MWASVHEGFARFDPATAEVVDGSPDLDPALFSDCCMTLGVDERGIWFLGYDGVRGKGPVRLDLFDPATGTVLELVELGEGTPVAMAVAPEGVWVLNYEGTLTHIALG